MPFKEETITDILLLELATHFPNQVHLTPFTRAKEKHVGADWEWWFYAYPKGIGFRVQAKRLDRRSQLYKSIKPSQTDRLIEVSKLDGLIPLFCFYNLECEAAKLTRPLQGCSVSDARAIRPVNSKAAGKIVPRTRPWHELLCPLGKENNSLERIASIVRDFGFEEQPIRRLPQYVSDLMLEKKLSSDIEDQVHSRDKPNRAFPIRGIITIEVE